MALKPEFISLLRDIRDRIYPTLDLAYIDMKAMYDEGIAKMGTLDLVYDDIRVIEKNVKSIEAKMSSISVGTVSTVVTNPDGSHGIASANYEPTTSVLNLSIPAGSTGATGSIGSTGVQGVEGQKGVQGLQGAIGHIGVDGTQGIQGIKGDDGDEGPTGPTGSQGTTGGAGPQGIQGAIGPDGLIGAQGPAGLGIDIVGTDTVANVKLKPSTHPGESWLVSDGGLDGDGLNVRAGDVLRATGSKWINIGPIQGPKGDQGITGTTGSQGIQGADGTQGVQGIQGEKGIQGATGTTGAQGTKGDTGDQGPDGIQGPIGTDGPQGTQGVKGDDGNTGPKGDIGNTGIQGLVGPEGPKGNIGLTGLQGIQGITGATGAAGQLTLQRLLFTAVQDQTSFTVAYRVGTHMQVIVDGKTLDTSMYDATSGIDVVLNTGVNLGQKVQVWTYEGFDVADVYTKQESDQKYVTADGGTAFTQYITVPAGATGSQVPRADEILPRYKASAIDFKVDGQNITPHHFKNFIINGGMDIWQRGDSITTVGTEKYAIDRWIFLSAMQGVKTMGYTSIGSMANLYTSGTYQGIKQRIEIPGTTLTSKLTLSFYLINALDFPELTVGIKWQNGTITTRPVTNIASDGRACQVILDKPLDYTSGDYLEVTIYFSLSTSLTKVAAIGKIQLENGSIATLFERRPIALELSLCQRYYYNSGVINIVNDAYQVVRGYSNVIIPLPVTMRKLPNVTASMSVGSNCDDPPTLTAKTTSLLVFGIRAIVQGRMYGYLTYYSADAEL